MADGYTPGYYSGSGSDVYPQPPQPKPTGTSALFDALQSVGLVYNTAIPNVLGATAPNTYPTYQQPHHPESWFLGIDPTTGQITQDIGDDKVFLGGHTSEGVPQPHVGVPQAEGTEVGPVTTTKHTPTVNQAFNLPYTWSDDKVSEIMKRMRAAGINVQNFDDMLTTWKGLVTRASRAFTLSGGKQEVTPWDILASTKKENIAAGVLDKDGNIVTKSVSTSVNDLSEGDAWATLRAATENALGRKPSDQEVRDFLSRANNLAAKDPSRTVTTSTTDVQSGDTTTSSNTTGGYTANDAAMAATDDLENTDEYAQYQASTTYFNALNQALGEVA